MVTFARYPIPFYAYVVLLSASAATVGVLAGVDLHRNLALTTIFIALLVVAEVADLPVYGDNEAWGLGAGDAIVLPMIFALPLGEVVVAAALAMALARAIEIRHDVVKELFNVAQYACAAAIAALLMAALHDPGGGFSPRNAGAAIVAVLVFAALTHLFVTAGLALAGRVAFLDGLRATVPAALFNLGGNIVLGLFFAAAFLAARWTVLLFPIPLTALYFGLRAVLRQHDDRRRIARLLEASHALSSATSLSDALDGFLHAVARTVSARGARAIVTTRKGVAWSGIYDEEIVGGLEPVAEGEMFDALERIRTDFRPVVAGDGDPASANLRAALGARNLVIAPLFEDGDVRGALMVIDREGTDGFGDDDVALLQSFSNELSVTMGSARMLDEMVEERERFQLLVEAVNDYAIYMTDLNGHVVSWNAGAQRILGYDAGEIVGQHFSHFYPPDALPTLWESELAQATNAGRAEIEGWRVRRDGHSFLANEIIAPVRDRSGEMRGFATVTRDITSLRRAEQERVSLEEQLHQSQRLESVGQLAGGVAHDFNNLLSVIINCANFALEDLDAGAAVRTDVEEMKSAAKRAAALTRQLLVFARRDVVERQVLDFNDIVTGLHKLLRRALGEKISFAMRLADDLDPMVGDPGQMEQILMNLAINARDAMPDGGTFQIETSNLELDESTARRYIDAEPGRFVRIRLSDTGVGMSEDTARKAFDPFFTTKPVGSGTGLGLATVYGIVQGALGHIEIDSEERHGTTFEILFPAQPDRAVGLVLDIEREELPPGQGETVLLVEDEESVRRVAERVLASNGYHVVGVSNGTEALSLLKSDGVGIGVVVTDVAMPGMSGTELVAELRELRPDLSVILMSGFSAEVVGSTGLDLGRFIQKPLVPEELLAKVSDALHTWGREA